MVLSFQMAFRHGQRTVLTDLWTRCRTTRRIRCNASVSVVVCGPQAGFWPAVVLLHGWPDSVLRFERLLPLLDDLHVVAPALPGFPFSHDLAQPGMTVARMASLIAEAMQTLGYNRYVISGGDIGADVAEHLATQHPDRVAALHLTNIGPVAVSFRSGAVMSGCRSR